MRNVPLTAEWRRQQRFEIRRQAKVAVKRFKQLRSLSADEKVQKSRSILHKQVRLSEVKVQSAALEKASFVITLATSFSFGGALASFLLHPRLLGDSNRLHVVALIGGLASILAGSLAAALLAKIHRALGRPLSINGYYFLVSSPFLVSGATLLTSIAQHPTIGLLAKLAQHPYLTLFTVGASVAPFAALWAVSTETLVGMYTARGLRRCSDAHLTNTLIPE